MRKILTIILTTLMILICIIWLKFTSDVTTIKIDYKNNIVEIDNNSDEEFKLKLVTKDIDSKAQLRQTKYFNVKIGSYRYSLTFIDLNDFQIDTINNKDIPKNSIIIYTEIKNDKHDNGGLEVRLVGFTECSNLSFNDNDAQILFNTAYNPNLYFRYMGLKNTSENLCGGGIGGLQDVDRKLKGQIYIGGANQGATSGAPVESL